DRCHARATSRAGGDRASRPAATRSTRPRAARNDCADARSIAGRRATLHRESCPGSARECHALIREAGRVYVPRTLRRGPPPRVTSKRLRPRASANSEVGGDAREHREAEPVIVQERAEAPVALARADQPEVPRRTHRRCTETRIVERTSSPVVADR